MTLHQKLKGRHRELPLLDELWEMADPTLLILYGRRRVGKTRLMNHWFRAKGRKPTLSKRLKTTSRFKPARPRRFGWNLFLDKP